MKQCLHKRLFSLLLTVVMTIALIPSTNTTQVKAWFAPVVTIIGNDTAKIDGMLDAISTQANIGNGLNLAKHLIYTSSFRPKELGGGQFLYPNSSPTYFYTVTDGTYTKDIHGSKGCMAYSNWVSKVFFDIDTGATKVYEAETAGQMTAANLKIFIQNNLQVGEHIRIDNNHSVSYISCDEEGFYYSNYLNDSDPYITFMYATYESFANACNAVGKQIWVYNANTAVNTTSGTTTGAGVEVTSVAGSNVNVTEDGTQSSEEQKIGYLFFKNISLNAQNFDNSQLPNGVSYDLNTNTILLNGCNISEGDYDNLIRYYGSIPLNIEVRGNNKFQDTSPEYGGFIITSAAKDNGNASVYIYGDGVIEAQNYNGVVDFATTVYDLNNTLSIDGVTIISNSGGLRNVGGIIINNATINIDNKYDNMTNGITTYSIYHSEGGKLVIGNSNITLSNCYLNCRTYEMSAVDVYIDNNTNSVGCENILQARECPYGSGKYYTKPEGISVVKMIANPAAGTQMPLPGEVALQVEETTSPEVSSVEASTSVTATQNVQGATSVSKPVRVNKLKVKNLKSNKVKLTWKKIKDASGYQIRYATDKKFKNSKKVLVKTNAKSKEIKKLKKNRIYYFKVRGYKKLKGKRVYGKWSKVKKVKIR